MTQENDSSALPGQTPGQAAAPAKKTGSATKKTTARKTPAQKAASPAKQATAAETANAPAKKPRATAKTATAKPTETTATAPAAQTDAETVKTPAKPRRAPSAGKTASTTETAKPKTAKPRAPRRAASAPKTAEPVAETPSTLAEKEPLAVQRTAPSAAPAQADSPAATASETDHASDAPAKPASRRSRRGGRRRNKARATAEKHADAPETVMPTPEMEHPDPIPAQDVPEESVAPLVKTPAAAKAEHSGTSAPAVKEKKVQPKAEAPIQSGKRKMFISVLSGELVEVVLAEEGAVLEYYVEMQHQAKVKGNIYKGVVSNIDANLQAAFISYAGGVKNGFLQIDEVHPEYYASHHDPAKGRKFPPIQKVLKPGQEILVQVVKEPAGTKGAFLTSYLSLPGRFLVLTPGREQIGVSRKVENDEERTRLRGLLEGLKPGPGLGVIVRTASTGAVKTSLQRDLQFLKRLWKDVRTKGQTSPAPGLIYEELDLSTRAVRDYLTEDVQEVWVDDMATADQVTELASLLFPKKQELVHLHHDSGQTLFERFSLQRQLDQIHAREVSLPSGGSLVIDKTEALTAIDINSGRSGGKTNFEDMAYRTNLEAAKAIPLQLRLRDIGGQIVADFIEMRDREHWREVEKTVRNGMKGDRARYDVGKIGPFGMLEIVRQRLGSSAISISTEPCPCCKGTGIRRNMEWQAMQALRDINKHLRAAAANSQPAMTYHLETELAFYLLNAKRTILQSLENESGVVLTLAPKME